VRRLTTRQRIAAIVLAVLAICFVTLDLGGGSLQAAHGGARGTLGALYRGTDAVLGPLRRFVQGVPHAGTNQSRIDALRQENARLRGELAAAQADERTRAALETLQLAATSGRHRIVPARVIALGAGQGFDWTVTLDVGRADGVQAGQTVTDGAGLVGRVLHVDRSSGVVLLAADPGSGVGARDVRTGEVGLVTARGTAGFTFVPLDPEADVRAGDALVTGPAGATSYVPGLAIGTVTAVRRSSDGTTSVTVRAAVKASSLNLVGVILSGDAPQPDGSRAALQPGADR
jgi:rod shape-determining protein MreC